MGHTITIKAAFGDFNKTVELSRLPGPYWHIYIDRFFYGQVVLRDGKWEVALHNEDSLEPYDLEVISEEVTEYEATQNQHY